MLKRAISVGVALACALFLSVCSFADTVIVDHNISSDITLGFPYYRSFYLRPSPTSQETIASSISSGMPVCSSFTTVPSSITSRSFNSLNFAFVLGGTNVITFDQESSYLSDGDNLYYNGAIENITVRNNLIDGGYYTVSGFLNIQSGVIESIDDWFTGSSSVYIRVGSSGVPDVFSCDVVKSEISFSDNSKQTIQFTCSFNVPSSFDTGNVGGQVIVSLATYNNVSIKINSVGVTTSGFEYKDTITGIGGLSVKLSDWFSGIKSGLGSIGMLIRGRDDDAQQAASDADRAAVSEASSAVQEIHHFESDLNTNITSGVSQIDFTVPSTSGFLGAMGAITVVMGSVFENLGAYQFIITIPLILGILLLLLGRGMSALGKYQDNQVRAERRERRYGGR